MRAFTLVEVLVALVLTSLLLTVVGQVAVQMAVAEDSIRTAAQTRARIEYPLQTLERDWAGMLPGESPVIDLDAHHRSRLQLVARVAEPTDDLYTPQVPARITYRLVQSHEPDGGLQWLREVEPLVHAASRGSTRVATQVSRVDCELFDGRGWQPLSARTLSLATRCQAVRMTCVWMPITPLSPTTRTFVVRSESDE
ncbi:MAG: prepilin-type N-terminal cleavage/methylation domain-containing protein [Phycisphaerae bacterium]|nr:prepilin-type N-terminal cleavage/methylation domain-containing protein [Phycisphaerae bacterium]